MCVGVVRIAIIYYKHDISRSRGRLPRRDTSVNSRLCPRKHDSDKEKIRRTTDTTNGNELRTRVPTQLLRNRLGLLYSTLELGFSQWLNFLRRFSILRHLHFVLSFSFPGLCSIVFLLPALLPLEYHIVLLQSVTCRRNQCRPGTGICLRTFQSVNVCRCSEKCEQLLQTRYIPE